MGFGSFGGLEFWISSLEFGVLDFKFGIYKYLGLGLGELRIKRYYSFCLVARTVQLYEVLYNKLDFYSSISKVIHIKFGVSSSKQKKF